MNAQLVKLTILRDADDEKPAGLHAQELQDAILNEVPAGTKVSLEASDPTDMQLGETILIEIMTTIALKAVFEGIDWYRHHHGKVRIQLEAGNVRVIDETKGEFAAAYAELEKRLAPAANPEE